MPTYRANVHLGDKDPLVESDDISNGSITTPKIADGAVTEKKLADGAVTTDKIADGAITVDKLSSGVIDELTEKKTHKGSIVMCSVFITDNSWKHSVIDMNEGKVGTYVYRPGLLRFKSSEEQAYLDEDKKAPYTRGIYDLATLSKYDIYVNINTEERYRWDGKEMILLDVPLTDDEINEIANTKVKVTTSRQSNTVLTSNQEKTEEKKEIKKEYNSPTYELKQESSSAKTSSSDHIEIVNIDNSEPRKATIVEY